MTSVSDVTVDRWENKRSHKRESTDSNVTNVLENEWL